MKSHAATFVTAALLVLSPFCSTAQSETIQRQRQDDSAGSTTIRGLGTTTTKKSAPPDVCFRQKRTSQN